MKKVSKKLLAILLVASMLFTNTSAVSAKGWWFSFLFENKKEETTVEETTEETTTIEESLVVEDEEKVDEAGEELVGANSVSPEEVDEETEEVNSVNPEDVEEPEADETEAGEESVGANSESPEEAETEESEVVVVDENEEEKVSEKPVKEASSEDDGECLVSFYDRFGFFNYEYGNRGEYQTVKKGSKVDFPDEGNNPGWEFKGWFLIDTTYPSDWWIDKSSPFDINTPVNEDSCFCAYWEEIEYPIIWHSDEVQLTGVLYDNFSTKTYRQNISLIMSERDEDLGHGFGDWWYEWNDAYDFAGFYKDPNFKVQIFEIPSNEEGPYHVYVKWKLATVDVEFVDKNKGTWTEKAIYGSPISEPEVPGEGFKHWYLVFSLDENGNTRESLPEIPFDFNTQIRGRKYKLKSVYEDDVIPIRKCSFRFVTDYGTAPYNGDEIDVRIGEKVDYPGPPTDIENVKGLKFSHWYLRKYLEDDMSDAAKASRLKPFDFSQMITESFYNKDVDLLWTLKAYWVEGEPETETEPETEAPKTETGKVEFVLNGGAFKDGYDITPYSNIELNTVTYLPTENDVYYPGDSTAVFKGWFKNKDLKGNANVLGVNMTQAGTTTLYAKWKITPKYKVEFALNNTKFKNGYDVSKFDAISVNTNTTLPTANDVEYTGTGEAEFAGWYRNADLTGDKVESVNESSATTIKVYPKWNVIEYVTIEIGPSLRYRYLREQNPNSKTDYSSIFVGGTNVSLKVKKGEKITVPDMNNSIHFRTYDLTYKDVWTGYIHTGYRVMRKSNLRMSYNNVIYRPGDEFVVEEDGLIMYAGDSQTLSSKKFTRQEIIDTYGTPIYEERGTDQDPKPAPAPKSSSSGGSSGGGGGSSGGGGGGGGGVSLPKSSAAGGGGPAADNSLTPLSNQKEAAPLAQMPQEEKAKEAVQIAPNAVQNQQDAKQASGDSYTFNSSESSWKQNADGTWAMTISVNGENVPASNGFYSLLDKDANTGAVSNSVYYFDSQGQMATGWVKDANNNVYFFETANTTDVGKMITGWKEISGGSYFFGTDGKMLTNSITPDGKYVGADGNIVSSGTSLNPTEETLANKQVA